MAAVVNLFRTALLVQRRLRFCHQPPVQLHGKIQMLVTLDWEHGNG